MSNLSIAGVIFTIIAGYFLLYDRIIAPKLVKTKLKAVSEMIDDWFDYIDCNFEKGIDYAVLNNKERKINSYIDENLKTYWIKPSKRIIKA